MSAYPLQELKTAFFEDPRWSGVEELIQTYIDPLLDMRKIDVTKSAEDVKAQVIGRIEAYDRLNEFLTHVKLIKSPKRELPNTNPYR